MPYRECEFYALSLEFSVVTLGMLMDDVLCEGETFCIIRITQFCIIFDISERKIMTIVAFSRKIHTRYKFFEICCCASNVNVDLSSVVVGFAETVE